MQFSSIFTGLTLAMVVSANIPPSPQPSGVKECPATQVPACCLTAPKSYQKKCSQTYSTGIYGYICSPPSVLACCDKSGIQYGAIKDGTHCDPY